MTLLVDLGNTRLKWATWRDGRLCDGGAVPHRDLDLAEVLDQAWLGLARPGSCRIASVARPAMRDTLRDWIADRWQLDAVFVASQAEQAGVRNGYRDPTQLGVDRWLALIGAWRRVGGAVCVADCGSALTVDILDSRGQHLGGVIAPGLQLMSAALQQGTALPPLQAGPDSTLGRDTGTAMAAGTVEALRGLVDRCRAQAPPGARLLFTGGDAAVIARGIAAPHELIPDLVLEGLAGTLDGA